MDWIKKNNGKRAEFIRFAIVGTIAAAIHYSVYCLAQLFVNVNIAYTLGYGISLVGNFFLTSYFTFKAGPSTKKAAGFGFSHFVNYMLHMVLLNLFLSLGAHKLVAPVLVMSIAVPVNFLLLRFVFKSKHFGNKVKKE